VLTSASDIGLALTRRALGTRYLFVCVYVCVRVCVCVFVCEDTEECVEDHI